MPLDDETKAALAGLRDAGLVDETTVLWCKDDETGEVEVHTVREALDAQDKVTLVAFDETEVA